MNEAIYRQAKHYYIQIYSVNFTYISINVVYINNNVTIIY